MKARTLQALGLFGLMLAALLLDSMLFAGSALVSLAVVFPVIARSEDQLQELASPPSGKGVSEAVPWVWFDTETYVDTATVQLNFFNTTKAPGLSNMSLAGQFPSGEYFECYYIGMDPLIPPSVVPLAAWGDMWALIFGTGVAGAGTPTWNFVMSGKEYGPFPLSFLHGSGGLHGSSGYGTTTADTTGREHAANSVPDGGYSVNGSILIPPGAGFRVRLAWPVALNIAASRDIRVWLQGTHHRKVV